MKLYNVFCEFKRFGLEESVGYFIVKLWCSLGSVKVYDEEPQSA
jgi:hypothetical protein